MSFSPYLAFNGNAREAMTFYAEVFGATDLQIMGADTAPADVNMGDMTNRVMHAQLSAGPGAPLMGSDLPAGMSATGLSPTVFHAAADLATAQAAFARLSQGGQVVMPLEPTFWSPGYGICVDRFGTRWMITVVATQA
jgi:PhnB protein